MHWKRQSNHSMLYGLLLLLLRFSCVRLCATLWTVACQAPLSREFSRQEYWSGWPSPPPGDLPHPCLLHCRPLTLSHLGSPRGILEELNWKNFLWKSLSWLDVSANSGIRVEESPTSVLQRWWLHGTSWQKITEGCLYQLCSEQDMYPRLPRVDMVSKNKWPNIALMSRD